MLGDMVKKELSFGSAFGFPFNRAKGLWNILWILVPIIGWFALGGYCVRIVQGFLKGKFKELPEMEFRSDLGLGCRMFLKSIPFIVAYSIVSLALSFAPFVGRASLLFLEIFVIPMLGVNFIKKMTVDSFFEFGVVKVVFENIADYFMVIVKSIFLCVVFFLMSIILIGIPAQLFTQHIFLADFYRRNVKG